jgi:hypothetical protein
MRNIGTPSLHRCAKETINLLSEEQFICVSKAHRELIKLSNTEDWFLPYLCQYDFRNGPNIEEAYYYLLIKKMIVDGHLYFAFINCDNWAYSDSNRDSNYKNISDTGILVSKNEEGYQDGDFEIDRTIELTKMYLTDEETPDDAPVISFNSLSGVIEIGTQTIAKTYNYLFEGIPLLRVIYDPQISWFKPKIGILYYTGKKSWEVMSDIFESFVLNPEQP